MHSLRCFAVLILILTAHGCDSTPVEPTTHSTVQPAPFSASTIRIQVTKVSNLNSLSFVHLNVGTNGGVATGLEFILHRDSNYLGRARIIHVEEQASVAIVFLECAKMKQGDLAMPAMGNDVRSCVHFPKEKAFTKEALESHAKAKEFVDKLTAFMTKLPPKERDDFRRNARLFHEHWVAVGVALHQPVLELK